MSLDDVYRAFAGAPGHMTCPGGVQPKTRMVEPMGYVEHHEMQNGRREVPTSEVEALLAALSDAGRDLGPELVTQVRARLMPLGWRVRADLVPDDRQHLMFHLSGLPAAEAIKTYASYRWSFPHIGK